jgi:hypothetical protein
MATFHYLLRMFWTYVGPVLGVYGLARALEVHVTLTDIAATRAFQALTTHPILSALGSLILYFAYVEIRHRRVPITVTSLNIELAMKSESGDEAVLTRRQEILANHENVTGYLRSISGDGTIPWDAVECQSDHCPSARQAKLVIDKSDNRVEFIHRFDPIPRRILWPKKIIRTETIIQRYSYTKPKETFTLTVPAHYRARRVTITIFFHANRACRHNDCEAMKIRADGATELPLEHVPASHGNGPGVRLTIRRPKPGERYLIGWTYPPVRERNVSARPALIFPRPAQTDLNS